MKKTFDLYLISFEITDKIQQKVFYTLQDPLFLQHKLTVAFERHTSATWYKYKLRNKRIFLESMYVSNAV